MLQPLGRKKSASLNSDLVIGGACVIHHKITPNKRSFFHHKTDTICKPDLNVNILSSENLQFDGFSFKISSSEKNKIKYLKHIYKEKISKLTSSQTSKQKSQKSLFKKKNVASTEDDLLKEDEEVLGSQSKRFRKKLRIMNFQNNDGREFSSDKSQTKLQKKVFPQITEKYRSYTTSNSKKQLKKESPYEFSQDAINLNFNKDKKEIRKERPLPNLHLSENGQNKLRLSRNHTTKIEKIRDVIKSQKTVSTKTNEVRNTSVAKKEKKEFQSQKDMKVFTNQVCQILRDEKEKNPKLHIIRDEFTSVINKTNEIEVINDSCCFNAYIEKGNNGMLVKELIKKRWWWHWTDENPKEKIIEEISVSNQNNPIIQNPLSSLKKKVNLYWSEWLSKGFAQKLQIPSEKILNFNTIYEDFNFTPPEEQQRYESVKKITDQHTFCMIRDKISLRNANYFKSRNPKPLQTKEICKSSQIKDMNMNLERNPTKEVQLFPFKRVQNPHEMKIHNHLIGCLELHSKKLLFKNFSSYLKKKNMNPFQFIPLTFCIEDLNSENYRDFLRYEEQHRKRATQEGSQSIWILKPGENSNRGFGISIHKQKQQIQEELTKRLSFKSKTQEQVPLKKAKKSVIVQKYIQKCFLYQSNYLRINNRKFDFRCYILITTVNGILKGYWYGNGYIRTSSEEYDLSDIQNRMIHLTNDAVQSKNSSFGKFEDYNKMNFEGFKKYLERQKIPESKFDEAFQQMKKIAYYLIASVSSKIKRYQYTFELFGLDFMLDENLNPFLIEANSNPCLDTKGPILTKIIRNLVENVIMTAIDPLFPPPKNLAPKKKKQELDRDYFEANMFELIFTDKKPSQRQSN